MLGAHVFRQILRPFEGFATQMAAVGTLLGVGREVSLELVLARALAPALDANVPLSRAAQQERTALRHVERGAGFTQLTCCV